jgi:hypothetical protein
MKPFEQSNSFVWVAMGNKIAGFARFQDGDVRGKISDCVTKHNLSNNHDALYMRDLPR